MEIQVDRETLHRMMRRLSPAHFRDEGVSTTTELAIQDAALKLAHATAASGNDIVKIQVG